LDGKEIGKEYTFEVLPEEAFGKRNSKLIQLAPTSFFQKKRINPVPGLQLAVDDALATVRSVSAGRVILDFNHPLAGRTLAYWVKVTRKITKEDEKIKGLVELLLGLDAKITIGEKEDIIEIKGKLGDKVLERVTKQIKELVPEASKKEVKFISEQIKSKDKDTKTTPEVPKEKKE
jgi:FKBP-type peptidyl-prolyl cis-trans isomerase 2